MDSTRDWWLDRIDFVDPGTLCDAGCNRVLKQAHVVIEGGKPLLYGSDCIKKKFGGDNEAYRRAKSLCPDVTRRAVLSNERVGARAKGQGGGVTTDSATDEARFAAEYLWLRMEAFHVLCPPIAENHFMRWDVMVEVFERKRATGRLERPDIQKIINTEKGAREGALIWLSLDNLLDLYTVLREMKRIDPDNKIEYFDSLRTYISKNFYLTQRQVQAAINWKVRISKDAFAWAHVSH